MNKAAFGFESQRLRFTVLSFGKIQVFPICGKWSAFSAFFFLLFFLSLFSQCLNQCLRSSRRTLPWLLSSLYLKASVLYRNRAVFYVINLLHIQIQYITKQVESIYYMSTHIFVTKVLNVLLYFEKTWIWPTFFTLVLCLLPMSQMEGLMLWYMRHTLPLST